VAKGEVVELRGGLRIMHINTISELVYKPFLLVSSLDYLYEFVWDREMIDRYYILGFASVHGSIDFSHSVRLANYNVIRRADKLKAVSLIIGTFGLFVFHYTSEVKLPRYVRSVMHAFTFCDRGVHLLYVVAQLKPSYQFKLSRSSADADVELNPGPPALTVRDVVNATFIVTAVPLLGFVLAWEVFLLWVVFVIHMVIYYPEPGTERSFYRKYRPFVIPMFLSLAVTVSNYVDQFRLARDSTQHDIELNPGPAYWLDDAEGNVLLSGLGTLLHQYDVRSVLIASGVNSSALDTKYQRCVSAEACAKYYHSLYPRGDYILVPAGVSAGAVAKAFRAVYPLLRDGYVKHLQNEFPTSALCLPKLGAFPVCERIRRLVEHEAGSGANDTVVKDSVARYFQLEDEIEQLSLLEARALSSTNSLQESSAVRGMFCEDCQCHVNPEDHKSRCRPVKPPVSGQKKVAAWIGDAIHTLDVRIALVHACVPEKRLGILCDTFKSASAQARFVREHGYSLGLRLDNDESDRRLSTEFEAMYGGFRSAYIAKLVEDVNDVAASLEVSSYVASTALAPFDLHDFSFFDLL
jgi:23S rRNA maturation mini-RNase III